MRTNKNSAGSTALVLVPIMLHPILHASLQLQLPCIARVKAAPKESAAHQKGTRSHEGTIHCQIIFKKDK